MVPRWGSVGAPRGSMGPDGAPWGPDGTPSESEWIEEHEHRWLEEVSVLPKMDAAEFMRRTSPSRH